MFDLCFSLSGQNEDITGRSAFLTFLTFLTVMIKCIEGSEKVKNVTIRTVARYKEKFTEYIMKSFRDM